MRGVPKAGFRKVTTPPPIERFVTKFEVEDRGHETACWVWTGALTRKGYGHFSVNSGYFGAHRFAYLHYRGLIPPGMVLDHLCRVRHCVNPDHLEPVTSAENTRRGLIPLSKWTKTHCPQGHPYEGDNVQIDKRGARHCRTCRRERERERVRPRRCRPCAQRKRWWSDLLVIARGLRTDGVFHWYATVAEGDHRRLCEMDGRKRTIRWEVAS